MTDNPPAAATIQQGQKYEAEGLDFWYNVCRIYEENDDNDVAKAKLLHH